MQWRDREGINEPASERLLVAQPGHAVVQSLRPVTEVTRRSGETAGLASLLMTDAVEKGAEELTEQ